MNSLKKILKLARRVKAWKVLLWILVLGFLLGAAFFWSIVRSLPPFELIQNRKIAESTKIFDRSGEVLLYELYDEEKRTIISLEEIPEYVRWATIAIEDADFYNHGAIDVRGIIRAIFVNLKSGKVVQGGSTITQQLTKKAFLTDDRTFTRKAKELILAWRLEDTFTKDEILELYLNQIPYGSNAYGIESAAQSFFQKPASELSLAQAALLASLPRAPSYYSPWGSHVDELVSRQRLTLQRMYELGYINKEDLESALAEELKFAKPENLLSAPHFVIAIQEYLNEKYGEEFVRSAGLKVTTTLDAKMQEYAEAAVKAGAQRNEELYNGKNAALVAQDSATGQILAMVGSRDYFNEEIDGAFNVVTQGLRQPGSALKPFIYLSALQLGYTPQTILFDVQTEFDTTNDPAKSYQPHNFDGIFRGPVSLQDALAQSINVPAVKALYLAGIDNVLRTLASFGINTLTERSRYGLSLVLGGGEVKLIELVGAYSVLSQEGLRHEQSMILKIESGRGEILEEYRNSATQVFESQPIRQINNILADANARAPLFSSSLGQTVFPGYEVAIKTGTTNDYRDAWAVGYTPSLVAGVWAGNSDNQPMERRGGSILAAIPILHSFLSEALPKTPASFFNRPDPAYQPKPMLNGEYIAVFESQGKSYPQIHNILHYVNRLDPLGNLPENPDLDPQYKNWEEAVLRWATLNISGFNPGVNYNQPTPPGATLKSESIQRPNSFLEITSPKNGSFITSNLTVEFSASMPEKISRVDIIFNNSLLQTKVINASKNLEFKENFSINSLEVQNILKVVVYDEKGGQREDEVILYR